MKNIIFDLDGTILEEDKRISVETEECIKTLSKSNVLTIATGRSLVGIPQSVFSLEKYINYYITSNGTTIYDSKRNLIYKDRFDYITSLNVVESLLSIPNTICEVLVDGEWHINEDDAARFELIGLKADVLEYVLNTRVRHKNLIDFLKSNKMPVEKLSVNICDPLISKATYSSVDEISKKYSLRYCSDRPHKIDIYKFDTSKGKSLLFLSNYCGVELKDFIAFGNDFNDIEMFEKCGLSVCMSSATKNVKKHANIILRKNDEKRIARAVNYLKSVKRI